MQRRFQVSNSFSTTKMKRKVHLCILFQLGNLFGSTLARIFSRDPRHLFGFKINYSNAYNVWGVFSHASTSQEKIHAPRSARTIEMHVDMSQKQFDARIPNSSSLRSQNAHGHVTKTTLCKRNTAPGHLEKFAAQTSHEPAHSKCTWTSKSAWEQMEHPDRI